MALKALTAGNGNTTGITGASTDVSITWNAENMPTSTSYGGNITSKSFVGESLWKKVTGSTTTYYLPSMRVEVTGSTTAYRKYFGSFAERDPNDATACEDQPAKGCLKFYHGDHLGSSALVVELESTPSPHTPVVVHRQAYTPYGLDIVTPAPGPFSPKYQFNFKEKETDGTDDGIAFYDYGARMYNPATGRWLSADTSTTDGPNRYSYVMNNPLGHTDPTGHCSDWTSCWTTVKEFASGVFDTIGAPSPSEMGSLSAMLSSSPSLHAAVAANEAYLELLRDQYETGTPVYRAGVTAAPWLALAYQAGLGMATAANAENTSSGTLLGPKLGEGEFARVYAHKNYVLKVMKDRTYFDEHARSIVDGSNAARKALSGIIDVPPSRLGPNPGEIVQKRAYGFKWEQLDRTAQAAADEAVTSLSRPMEAAAERANIIIDLGPENFIYNANGKPTAFVDPVTPTPIQSPTGR
jgi:RHS repeat-associated protein